MADDDGTSKNNVTPLQVLRTRSREQDRAILRWRRALIWHSVALLTIIVLTWCEEAFYFFHQLFRQTPEQPNYVDAAITTLIITLVWIVSGMAIHRLVVRLNYLENFLHVCAWCRRIDDDGTWMDLENYLTQKEVGVLSHGICPDCSLKMESELSSLGPLDVGKDGNAAQGQNS